MTAWFENSPFHLVPCSPYVGTTVQSPAVRAVPDIGDASQGFGPSESQHSITSQNVPQVPIFHTEATTARRDSRLLSTPCMTKKPLHQSRAQTPEQEVPQTPVQNHSLQQKPTYVRRKRKPLDSRNVDSKEINLFGEDNIFA